MKRIIKTIMLGFLVMAIGFTVESFIAHSADINTLNAAFYHTEIATLDPHVQNSTEKCIVLMTCETLVTRNRDTLETVPKLATSWKISEGGKVYTFFLRKNVSISRMSRWDT